MHLPKPHHALRLILLPALCALAASSAAAQSFDIVKVADGVYAAIGKPGVFSNAAFIVNENDVLVVDTHLRPTWAKDLIAEIRKITDKPVRYVVNTHWHGDHVQGNQVYISVFGKNVEYLAQHNTREDMIHKAIPSVQDDLTKNVPESIQQLDKLLSGGQDRDGKPLSDKRREELAAQLAAQKSYLTELKQIQITLPTITFERSLAIHKPGRTIHIYYLGKGHTRGDVVVYLPKEKVVVSGDLLTNGIPFARDSYPVEWVSTLEGVQKLDWAQAIPGHGPVHQGKDQISKLIAFMKDVVAGVQAASAKGASLEDTKKSLDLSRHAANFPNFQNGAPAFIERAYQEVTGKIQD
jgi:cyclase